MENRRPARWFQLHRSTAVVLTLVAGVLLWLNLVHNCDRNYVKDFTFNGSEYTRVIATYKNYGWPVKQELTPPFIAFTNGPSKLADGSPVQLPIELPNLEPERIWTDVAIALAILAATAFALEFLTRRIANAKMRDEKSQLMSIG